MLRLPNLDIYPFQFPVIDKDLVTAPVGPSKGDYYIIAGIGGAWSGFATNDIVWYDGSAWQHVTPAEGFFLWVKDENKFYNFTGSAWSEIELQGLQNVVEDTTPQLGGDLDLNEHGFTGVTLAAASTDTDAFVVLDGTVLKKRTGAQVLSDIGGQAAAVGNTLIVAKSGGQYTTIQSAVTAASSGDTVLVYPGDYDEAITLKDGVDIVAVNPENTKILRQVTDNSVAVNSYCKINIDVSNGTTEGLVISGASNITWIGNVIGGAEFPAGKTSVLIYDNAYSTINFYGDITGNSSEGLMIIGKCIQIGENNNFTYHGNLYVGEDSGNGAHAIANKGNTVLFSESIISDGNTCIYNEGGSLSIFNSFIKSNYNSSSGHGINMPDGTVTLQNCKIVCTHADAKSIYSPTAKNVYCMNVWANRDDHANITQLNPSGFTVDTTIDGLEANFAAASSDTDKFLVSDSGVVKYRTGAQVLSDIGGQAAGSYLTDVDTADFVASALVTEGEGLNSSDNDTSIPTTAAVKDYADSLVAGLANAMVFKGTVGVGGTYEIAAFNSLATYSVGWSYKVTTAGTIKGNVCEIGDTIMATVSRSGSGELDADWVVSQVNIDGAVVGPASASNGRFAIFDGTSGKLLKNGEGAPGTMAYATATDYIEKALFNANTILAATTDNTPAALTVAEQTLVGRKTGGGIDDLNASDVRTILNVADGADVTSANETSHADVIVDGDFGANSILVATTIGTPVSTEIAASRMVGRKASGGIGPLTAAEARTILGLATTDSVLFGGLQVGASGSAFTSITYDNDLGVVIFETA